MPLLHPDRLFPSEPRTRDLARALYDTVRDAPIVSPHGHCDPAWFAQDAAFPDPARLFVTPDHYVLRMLYSQGETPARMGVARRDGAPVETDPRAIWRRFAAGYRFFAGTPSRLWLDHAFETLFGIEQRLSPDNADAIYDRIDAALREPGFRPRALYDRFNIRALTTTEGALDPLAHHAAIRASGWHGRILTAYRPDAAVDPDAPGFADNVRALGAMTGQDAEGWAGYLAAHRARRADFIAAGCTSTDHGHPTPRTLDLPQVEAAALFARCLSGAADAAEREAFRAQMLTEFARMSLDDGLVMQIHAGSRRNHNAAMFADHGPDAGFDIPG
ncbi:MAG: glucuronate isomerase, partial [Rubrimonas sp.]